jgi:TatD DNase family protein
LRLEELRLAIEENKEWITAIGEIGLDGKYTQDKYIRSKQDEVFRYFLTLAKEEDLPVVVHSRLAVPETLETLAEFKISRALLHWYDGPVENLRRIQDQGYLISIGPAIMYSRRISEITRAADLEIILSETDGPVTYRNLFGGRPAQPSCVIDVVKRIAEVKGLNLETVRSVIFSNFLAFISRPS